MLSATYQFFYDQMPEDSMRTFYTAALQAAQQQASSFTAPRATWMNAAGGQMNNILANAVLYMYGDHPELFDLNIGRFSSGWGMGGKVVVYLYYRHTGPQHAARQKTLEDTVQRILKECFPDGWEALTPLHREKIIYNYIVDHVTYDYASYNHPESWSRQETDAWSAYGALVNNKAVCQGIACAFKLLCDRVDIPSLVVIGRIKSNNERHAWNIAGIEHRFYHVDCTWTLRSSINTQIPYARYRYFNMADKIIHESRTIEMDYLPECTSLRHNPFAIRGCAARDVQQARQIFAQALNKGEKRCAVMMVGDVPDAMEFKNMFTALRKEHGRWIEWTREGRFIGMVAR